jgi:hypothetical protein
MEAKPFSIGFRIEHPQSLIDRARLGPNAGNPAARRRRLQARPSLPQRPLGVQLLHVPRRHGGRGDVRAGRVVTNGMSQYSRNERNANAGIVVGISPLDYPGIRWPASNSAPLESARLRTRRRHLRARRRNSSATSSPGGHRRALGAVTPSYSPACA